MVVKILKGQDNRYPNIIIMSTLRQEKELEYMTSP